MLVHALHRIELYGRFASENRIGHLAFSLQFGRSGL